MKWDLINSGERNGKFNMDFDFYLAKNYNPVNPILRFYRWNPYCISLGANQSFDEIEIEKANEDGIDIVKRPTGGRAILHSEELTYSVIYPIDYTTAAKDIYNEINIALRFGLIDFDESLVEIELEHKQPDFKEFYKSEMSAICFAVSAKSELNLNGKKIVGSAQRKIGNVILQHGSILCGDYHKKIVDYLKSDDSQKKSMLSEISATTLDFKSVLNRDIDYSKLIQSIISGFEKHFNAKFEHLSNLNQAKSNFAETFFVS
jgi:lipoate-protein ligase A